MPSLVQSTNGSDAKKSPRSPRDNQFLKDASEVKEIIKQRFVKAKKNQYTDVLKDTETWINKNSKNFISQQLIKKMLHTRE